MVAIDRVDEDPANPRTEFPAHEIDELTVDISERGVLQPIVVERIALSDRYLIRFGAKRLRAARLAGLTEVPVTVSARTRGVHDLVEQWRFGGSLIEEVSRRREAFNIMLSMPQGTDPKIVQQAARDFAQAELKDHSYVMVLHEHRANPHVHLAVRAESRFGARLNPRKADLHRWRETFAEKLRGRGIEAEATRQATRGANRRAEPLWRLKAREEGRLLRDGSARQAADPYRASRLGAMEAWAHIAQALDASERSEDRRLAIAVTRVVRESPVFRDWAMARQRVGRSPVDAPVRQPVQDRGPEISR